MNSASRNFDPLTSAKDFGVPAHDETEATGQHRVDLIDVVFVIGKDCPRFVDVLRDAVAERFELRAKARFRQRAIGRIPTMRCQLVFATSVGDGGMPGTDPPASS